MSFREAKSQFSKSIKKNHSSFYFFLYEQYFEVQRQKGVEETEKNFGPIGSKCKS